MICKTLITIPERLETSALETLLYEYKISPITDANVDDRLFEIN